MELPYFNQYPSDPAGTPTPRTWSIKTDLYTNDWEEELYTKGPENLPDSSFWGRMPTVHRTCQDGFLKVSTAGFMKMGRFGWEDSASQKQNSWNWLSSAFKGPHLNKYSGKNVHMCMHIYDTPL